MGLDCYIVKGNRDEVFKDERLEDLNLVGGLFSGHGNGSFRGKCYEEFVAHLTASSPGFWHLNDDEVIQSDELRVYGLLLREYLEDKGLSDLAKHLRSSKGVKIKQGVLEGRRVDYFKGSKLIITNFKFILFSN